MVSSEIQNGNELNQSGYVQHFHNHQGASASQYNQSLSTMASDCLKLGVFTVVSTGGLYQ
jgi:hypothetical protein